MKIYFTKLLLATLSLMMCAEMKAQKKEKVKVVTGKQANTIDVFIGNKLFTTFLYPDTLEKPVLYPIYAPSGTMVTRGFPLRPRIGDPTDHPHHLGLWLNYENVNDLDFWNNSYAIPANKKKYYGWIKTDHIIETKSGDKGILSYHANWTNQQNNILLEETTMFEFSGSGNQRIIDRTTVLRADTLVKFNDAKDGLLGLRVAHELQIPAREDRKFTDTKGIVTVVKGMKDSIASGNYLTSEGKQGKDVWSTRAVWCKLYGKMGQDSVTIAIIDHPNNPNYPTFWHARGYGLFAANPLGEKAFTNGKSEKNFQLQKGQSVTFRYRILIEEGSKSTSAEQLTKMAADFAKKAIK